MITRINPILGGLRDLSLAIQDLFDGLRLEEYLKLEETPSLSTRHEAVQRQKMKLGKYFRTFITALGYV